MTSGCVPEPARLFKNCEIGMGETDGRIEKAREKSTPVGSDVILWVPSLWG